MNIALSPSLRPEIMGPHFTKFHVDSLPFDAVFHRFTEVDLGDPHDHPWPFRSFILSGGYVEEVFPSSNAKGRLITRRPGTTHLVPASHIHRVVKLLAPECWTLILPLGPQERISGTYQFRADGTYHRPWNRPSWERLPRNKLRPPPAWYGEVQRLRAEGWTLAALAEHFDCADSTIQTALYPRYRRRIRNRSKRTSS